MVAILPIFVPVLVAFIGIRHRAHVSSHLAIQHLHLQKQADLFREDQQASNGEVCQSAEKVNRALPCCSRWLLQEKQSPADKPRLS